MTRPDPNSGCSPPPLPLDRGGIATEHRNPRSMRLHEASIDECVAMIQEEDRTIHDAMARARPSLVALIRDIDARFQRGGRVIYLGAGTSGRLGVLDSSEMPPTYHIDASRFVGIIAGGEASLRRSSEGKEDERDAARGELEALRLTPSDCVIGIAAGGTTPYVLGALEWVASLSRDRSARPLAALLTCSPGLRPSVADHVVVLDTGPEIVTGSTRMKAGTATKLALNTISTTLMVRSGRVHENLMVDLRATNDKLRDRAARIVATLVRCSREDAFTLLERAGGSAKVAVVMGVRRVERGAAEALLNQANGRLADAIRLAT